MNSIELRSEKVRSIIGKIPPATIRLGTTILFVVFVLLFVCSCLFPYYQTICVSAKIYSIIPSNQLPGHNYKAIVSIPIEYQFGIKDNQEVAIAIEGYDANKFGILEGRLTKKIIQTSYSENHKYMQLEVELPTTMQTNKGNLIAYYENMEGKASIVLNKRRLISVIIPQLE